MAKVFTWQQIYDRQVPASSTFAVVAQKIITDLSECEGIEAGVVCGSVVWGNANARSDIDCVVVYRPEVETSILRVLQGLVAYASDGRRHVPVEFIPLDSNSARTRVHHIQASFVRHLERAATRGFVIKTSPAPIFPLGHITAEEDILSYLRNKLRYFEKNRLKSAFMDDAERCRFLAKVLSAPVYIARKYLEWQGVVLENDSKPEVMRLWQDIGDSRLVELFNLVTQADSSYNAELERQCKKPDRLKYEACLDRLHAQTSNSLEFVRRVAHLIENPAT